MTTEENSGRNVILVVDDNQFNRDGLALYLHSQGYATVQAGTSQEALMVAQTTPLYAAIVDIVIPVDESQKAQISESVGLELVRELKKQNPLLGIVVFSAHEDRTSLVWDLVRDGVRGLAYMVKGNRPDRLLRAINDSVGGRVLLDVSGSITKNAIIQDVRSHLTDEEKPWVERAVALIPTLSPREFEIGKLLANSQNNMGISEALGLKPKTVENVVSRVYEKLDLSVLDGNGPGLRKSTLLTKAFMIFDLSQKENNH